MTALAPYLSAFLREHLPRERNASPHTVATYAHCFALLVRFAARQFGCQPSDLKIEDLNPDLVLRFLDEIETGRGNSARTRNAGSSRSGRSSVTWSTKFRLVWIRR